jgi:hypothetical protein
MADQALLDSNQIHLKEFKIIKGLINSPEKIKLKRINGFRSEVGLDIAFNLDKHAIKADIQVSAHSESEEKNKEEADTFFHIAYFFEIDNMSDLVKETGNKELEVHPYLSNAIASIAYSTTRGILLTRLQGTALRDFILPVIDPNSLIK